MDEIDEELVKEEVEELKDIEEVIAVAIVGSYARDPGGEHNDLDLYALVDDNWRKRETRKVENVIVERFFNSLEASEKYLEEDDWWKNYHWFKEADVRHDPERVFDHLVEKAEQVKNDRMKITDEKKREIASTIWDMKQDITPRDVSQKRFMMNKLFDYLLKKQYYLKNQIPVKENYRLEKLREFDGYMYKLSQDYLLASSTLEKEKHLEKIIEHVSRKLPEIAPRWETNREYIDD